MTRTRRRRVEKKKKKKKSETLLFFLFLSFFLSLSDVSSSPLLNSKDNDTMTKKTHKNDQKKQKNFCHTQNFF